MRIVENSLTQEFSLASLIQRGALAHFAGVAQLVKTDEANVPLDVGLFCAR